MLGLVYFRYEDFSIEGECSALMSNCKSILCSRPNFVIRKTQPVDHRTTSPSLSTHHLKHISCPPTPNYINKTCLRPTNPLTTDLNLPRTTRRLTQSPPQPLTPTDPPPRSLP